MKTDEAIRRLENLRETAEELSGETLTAVGMAIEALKTVRDLVRCKDCRYGDMNVTISKSEDRSVEINICSKYDKTVTESWYCADGKRRKL